MEWLYGRQVVKLVLAAGARRRALRLAATAPALRALERDLPKDLAREVVTPVELDRLTGSRDHQGVAVQVDAFRAVPLEELLAGEIVVVLDGVTDPHNIGAVARSGLAAGAAGLVLPNHRSATVTPAAVKASAGTLALLPVAQVTNVVEALKTAKRAGFWVYGAAAEADTAYTSLDLTGRIALVFGAEGKGLRPLVARTCDAVASIPMAAAVESLNVSVAAALFLFEARRQRASEAPKGAKVAQP
jgi:23S rRNA (guanosine2251-2'-O)-methyltransferase